MFTRKEHSFFNDPYFKIVREEQQYIEVQSVSTGHCWNVFKNQFEPTCKVKLYVIVRTNQQEVDTLLGNISETAPSPPKSGDFWYKVDHTAKSVTLMKYNGTLWANATEKQALTYTWYAQDKDGKEITFEKTGKVIYLSAADIDSIMTLQCDVSN